MDSFAEARQALVDELRRQGIEDERVLAAIAHTQREQFVPADLRGHSYEDRALPIDSGQTISQPYIVALMSQALELEGDERVLEIGAGSGYQAAVLSRLAREVYSIERRPELAEVAAERMARLGIANVRIAVGDGTLGWAEHAPYDRVIVTAAGEHMPATLFEQLVDGGILVMPVGGLDEQILRAVRKVDGQPVSEDLCGVRFVRLIGAEGWQS